MIRFFHIPRTGGATLHNEIIKYLGPDAKTLELRYDIDMDEVAREVIGVDYVYGHHSFLTGVDLIDNAEKVVALFRDPAKRAISWLRYVSDGRTRFPKKAVDFWLYEEPPDRMINFQTRLILGDEYDVLKDHPNECVEKAVHMVETKIGAYGLTEDYDRSFLHIRNTLGFRNWHYSPVNQSKTALSLSRSQFERIEELNGIDRKVYDKLASAYKEETRYISDAEVSRFRLESRVFWASEICSSKMKFVTGKLSKILNR